MPTLICAYCSETVLWRDSEAQPTECPNCFSSIEVAVQVPASAASTATSEALLPDGLTLTYIKTGETVRLAHEERIVIGREKAGSELLGKLPQVSRTHCFIEYRSGIYFISDAASTNGTFTGAAKKDCNKFPKQPLADGDVFYLGKEAFSIKVHLKTMSKSIATSVPSKPDTLPSDQENETDSATETTVKVQIDVAAAMKAKAAKTSQALPKPASDAPVAAGYECSGCHDFRSETKEFVCPKCGTFNG